MEVDVSSFKKKHIGDYGGIILVTTHNIGDFQNLLKKKTGHIGGASINIMIAYDSIQ